MSFDAATAVEPMGYDFTAFNGKAATIPEPTDDILSDFYKAWDRFRAWLNLDEVEEKADGEDDTYKSIAERHKGDPDGFQAEVDDVIEAAYARGAEAVARQKAMYAALCSNTPSVEEMDLLPRRVFAKFGQYLWECLNPND